MRIDLIRPLFLSVCVLVAAPGYASAAELTADVCEADYRELLSAIEQNRVAGIRQINDYLETLTDEKERARLIEMREKSWETEEEQVAMAGNIRRDCLAAVK